VSKLSKMINLVDKRLYLKANDECDNTDPLHVCCLQQALHSIDFDFATTDC